MLKKTKPLRYYSLLLIIICATTSFLSVRGWCIDDGDTSVETHVELSACHSKMRVCDETSSVTFERSHTVDNNNCTTCFDVQVDSSFIASKSIDDFFGSFVSPPPSSTIFFPQQYSELKSFSIASSGGVVAIDQSSSRQNPQTIAIRTVVLQI
jgi:hypothetical protein